MIKCSVAGCNNYYQLGMEIVHNEQYQESHQALLKSQVESLQCAIYDKVCEVPNWPTVTKHEFNIAPGMLEDDHLLEVKVIVKRLFNTRPGKSKNNKGTQYKQVLFLLMGKKCRVVE